MGRALRAMTPEEWLAEHAVECRRYSARLSPGACADYRREHPEGCRGCVRADLPLDQAPRPEPVRLAAPPRPRTQGNIQEKESEQMAKEGRCACGCGKTGLLIARGLLSRCYDRVKRSGQLKKYPKRGSTARAKGAAEASPPASEPSEVPLSREEIPEAVADAVVVSGQVAVGESVQDLAATPGRAEETPPASPPARERVNGYPVGQCRCCGATGRIYGRGLVKGCYERLRREGTLDERFPPLLRMPPRKAKGHVPAGYDGSVFARELDAVLGEVRAGLLTKNAAYGDSALNPVRVFSKADPYEQLGVRLDDKLSRLIRGHAAGEDTEEDLLGYLVLRRVAKRRGVRRR